MNKSRTSFTRERFGQMEFLALTSKPSSILARFDLNTMDCPFRVDYTIGAESYQSRAQVPGAVNPNPQGFLVWLVGLTLDLKSTEVANDPFGTTLQINVPCGIRHLGNYWAVTPSTLGLRLGAGAGLFAGARLGLPAALEIAPKPTPRRIAENRRLTRFLILLETVP